MKKLWDKRHFSGDLSISERMEKYQEDSKTPLERFIDKYYILADEEEKIVFNNFYVKLMKYYLENNISSESNIIIGKQLRHLGIENKNFNWKNDQSTLDPEQPLYTSKKTIFGLKVKEEI